ncbi:MAG: MoaD/ThiS family protein [Candidatus Bathyarchaeota archaeon]|nr:MoaD/ThiS family protein [Candidatus Bathyarchaeota archaeon]
MSNVSVKILLFATFRKKYGVKELTVDCDGTIKGLIESASKILGEDFLNDVYEKGREKVRDDLIFAVNGRNIKDLGGYVKLKDLDVVSIFPPLAGG